jgi:hypothetical protein
VPVTDSASIAGEWDVVSFEGYRPKRLRGSTRGSFADFGPSGVGLRIECNYSGRGGTVRDGRFIPADNNDRLQTVMSCGSEANERDRRFFTFFEQSPTIEHLGPDRLRLRAGGAELILSRPAAHRLNFIPAAQELQGRWRMVGLTAYDPKGGYSGIGLTDVPGRIVMEGDRLFYSRCPQYGLTFRFTAEGRLERTGGAAAPDTPTACRELAEPAINERLPGHREVLSLLHANPLVEKADANTLLISTDRLGLLITKAPCESLEQSNDHRRTRVVDCASPE